MAGKLHARSSGKSIWNPIGCLIAFINVPKGLPAKIIAISTDPTKGIRLGILPIITRQGQVGSIDTQPISAENLVKQLEAL